MKRGLVFAKYSTLAASTRQRIVQAMPYLEQAGIALNIHPLFDNDYLARLFSGQSRSAVGVANAYVKRVARLLNTRDYDFLWVHYELFPYLPGFMERLIGISGKPVLYDFDDAIFHQYDQNPRALVRALLGKKLVPLLRRTDIALCGNAYLRAYASQYCTRTELIPTTVDISVYTLRALTEPGAAVTVGWIGSPSTWRYCEALTGVLEEFISLPGRAVLVVGAQRAADSGSSFEFRDWSEADEIADIQRMDIGIMPVPDEPWARGKCGYKLIQYMACGIPVVASPVGVNREIVQHGVNGFLASTNQEWREALECLATDSGLRQRMGQAGRARAVAEYSIQRYGPQMAKLIHSL